MKAIYGRKARKALKAGVDELANAVRVTLGPTGRNVMFKVDGAPVITNDGIKTANNYRSDDPIAQMAIETAKQALAETDKEGGDGTTTAFVLVQAIFDECLRRINGGWLRRGVDPMALSVALKAEADQIIQNLENAAEKPKNLEDVATISVGGDRELGKLIASTVKRVGGGDVTIEGSTKLGLSVEITKGYLEHSGVATHLMLESGNRIVRDEVTVLVHKHELNDVKQVIDLLERVGAMEDRRVVFVAPDFSESLLFTFLQTNQRGKFSISAISSTDPQKVADALDVPLISTATPVSKTGPLPAAKKIVAQQDKTLYVGPGKTGKQKVAVIKFGAPTDVEFAEKALRIEDAVNAVVAAKKYGVVKGGGMALAEQSGESDILLVPLQAPNRQIRSNGFNGQIEDWVKDPVRVVTSALRAAVSAVSTLITTEVVFIEESEVKRG